MGWEAVGADDFGSVDPQGVDGLRQPDGNVPQLAFMRPKRTSRLIDLGNSVERPFQSPAPDLGACEAR